MGGGRASIGSGSQLGIERGHRESARSLPIGDICKPAVGASLLAMGRVLSLQLIDPPQYDA
jgi:hypothetical protein